MAHEQFRVLGEGEPAKTIKDCPVVVDVKGGVVVARCETRQQVQRCMSPRD